MERHASWFPLVAILLVVVGLVTLAAPPPAHAFDPQLALALASAAGAIALITGYLIVSNSREKQRAASFDGIYTCRQPESAGPMGCGGPSRPVPAAAGPMPEGPMSADSRGARGESTPIDGPMGSSLPGFVPLSAFSAAGPMIADDGIASRRGSLPARAVTCPGGQAMGPMGCGGPMDSTPTALAPAPAASAATPGASPYQGQ